LQIHYNYVFDSLTDSYTFVTKNNILYRIYLTADHTFSSISGKKIPNIYQLVIDKVSKEKEPFDISVSNTIDKIINQFFKEIENCLLYICQNSDNKASVRFELFERWFNKSLSNKHIKKINKIMIIDGGKGKVEKLHTSFLFHKKNPNYKSLLEIYNQIYVVLNSDK
jgi:hypothetical protein